MRYSASSRVSLMSLLSRALVTIRTCWMLERTRARPVCHCRREQTKRHNERGLREVGSGSERTELFAHLPYTYSRLSQLGSQASSKLFVVVVISSIQTQLMRSFLFRCGFLQALGLKPICQGSAVIEMGMDKTRRSRRLFHTWWEKRRCYL